MAGNAPLSIDTNIRIRGEIIDQTKPLDDRYGPWRSVSKAKTDLYRPERSINFVYYGLTIGVNIYETPGDYSSNVVGVDEYWWQPNCVPNPNYNPENPNSKRYIDGFVRKYPANTPTTVDKDNADKILGISKDSGEYGAVWSDDDSGSDWNDIGPETLEDVLTEDP